MGTKVTTTTDADYSVNDLAEGSVLLRDSAGANVSLSTTDFGAISSAFAANSSAVSDSLFFADGVARSALNVNSGVVADSLDFAGAAMSVSVAAVERAGENAMDTLAMSTRDLYGLLDSNLLNNAQVLNSAMDFAQQAQRSDDTDTSGDLIKWGAGAVVVIVVGSVILFRRGKS